MRTEYRKQKAKAEFVNYLIETWKNKLAVVAMVMAGVLGMVVCDNALALMGFLIIGIPLFFTKKDRFN